MSAVGIIRNGIPTVPSEDFLELFVAYCAQQLKIGYDSIKLYLSAVKHKYIENGYGDIFVDMPRLKLTLRGIRRVHAKPKRPRIPLTASMLHKVGMMLSGPGVIGQHEDTMLWAALCVGFFGALRCAEFTEGNLSLGDISFMQDKKLNKHFVSLTLKSSKTDPYRQGCNIFLFATGQLLCPYEALVKYFSSTMVAKRPPDQPLFIHTNGAALTRNSFLQNLHIVLGSANISSKGVLGHSLRKGLATTAAAANIQDSLISVMGRWASDCYKLYISTPLSSIASAQQTIASEIKD